MKNKIEYRAWDRENNKMIYANHSCEPFLLSLEGRKMDIMKGVVIEVSGTYELMQRIPELLNKIYVGDIVKEDFYISQLAEVIPQGDLPKAIPIKSRHKLIQTGGRWETKKQEDVFEIKSFRQIYEYLKALEDICGGEDIKKCRSGNMLKVIGNIWENPKLLEDKQ